MVFTPTTDRNQKGDRPRFCAKPLDKVKFPRDKVCAGGNPLAVVSGIQPLRQDTFAASEELTPLCDRSTIKTLNYSSFLKLEHSRTAADSWIASVGIWTTIASGARIALL